MADRDAQAAARDEYHRNMQRLQAERRRRRDPQVNADGLAKARRALRGEVPDDAA